MRHWTTGALLLTLAVSACSSTTDASAGDRLRVVATTTQVGSVAAEVGGEDVELTVLLAPGVEAHDFELTPAHGAALEQADVILVSGAGLEDWLADSLEAIGAGERVRDLSEGISPRSLDAGDDSGVAIDPHYWVSGPNAIVMTENVRDALADGDPDGAQGYEQRAAELVGRIEAADTDVRAMVDEVPPEDRRIVTDHDALGYFIDEYDLEFVGSVFPSLDVSAEPSAQDIEELVDRIRAEGVVAVFIESAVDPSLAEAVAAETDARLVKEPLYAESLGPPGSGADTLDGALLHNARVIRDGLLGG